jgi:cation transport protein ChaC
MRSATPNNNYKNDGFSPMEREAHEEITLEENGDLYVFGYGSIVWKFEIEGITPVETVRCKAFGWQRRFYQGSTDHRGTLEFPGRTVTMTKCSKNSPVSGVAYRIRKEDVEKCMENLEFREKQYDLRVQLEIYEDGDDDAKQTKKLISSKAVCWIATEDEKNVNWVGEQSIDEIATVIANAKGPSGPNYEYLFNLADAMRSFNIEDEHLYELEAKVRLQMRLQ